MELIIIHNEAEFVLALLIFGLIDIGIFSCLLMLFAIFEKEINKLVKFVLPYWRD